MAPLIVVANMDISTKQMNKNVLSVSLLVLDVQMKQHASLTLTEDTLITTTILIVDTQELSHQNTESH